MSLSPKQTQEFWTQSLFDGGAFRALAEQQIELWQKSQAALLDAWQPAAQAWFERRHRSVEAAGDLLRNLCACKDLTEASTAHQKWLSGAVERLTADSHGLMQGLMTAGQKSAEATRASTNAATAAAGSQAHPLPPRKAA